MATVWPTAQTELLNGLAADLNRARGVVVRVTASESC